MEYPAGQQSELDSATLGFKFTLPKTVVYAVDENSPAHKAGLKEGDEILLVQKQGKIGRDYDQILNIISESKGIPLLFTVRRPVAGVRPGASQAQASTGQSEILQLRITPIEDKGRVIIGFVPDIPSDVHKFGLAGALAQSLRRNYEMSSLIFRIVGRILKGSASARTLVGPIGIARISGSAARTRSVRVFLGFLALVSLNLGIFNLFPIPILDGGVIALLLIEALIGQDLSLNLKEKITQAGFVFLILLMGLVVFNDLSKIVDFNRLFR